MQSFSEAYVPSFVPESEVARFREGGYGGRIGWGDRPAIVVVDVTNQFASGEYALGPTDAGAAAVEHTRTLLSVARDADVPIVFTRGPSDPALAREYMSMRKGGSAYDDTAGNDIHPDLAPRQNEVVVEKPKPSAFFDTHLGNLLRQHGVDTVVVTGMSTSGCVRATAVDASSSDFRVVVAEECCADRAETSHRMALFELDMKYADVMPTADVVKHLRGVGEN